MFLLYVAQLRCCLSVGLSMHSDNSVVVADCAPKFKTSADAGGEAAVPGTLNDG